MAGTIIPWVAFFMFLILFTGSIIAEVQWLIRKGWTTSGRANGYVFTTDFLGFGIGGAIVFVAFFGIFMMVMGPAGRGSTVPESAYLAVSAVGLVIPLIIFLLIKGSFLIFSKSKQAKMRGYIRLLARWR
ncbi:MAG: hypothetical protein IPK98_05590 [Chloracidobacterium sp.]|nr:hypothetical protein [Chloracidobacterium sp.]